MERTAQSPLYLSVTPAGAYQSVSKGLPVLVRETLLHFLKQPSAPQFTPENLKQLTGQPSDSTASTIMQHLQNMRLVQALDAPQSVPTDSMETLLPQLLSELSSSNRALLADDKGLYLGMHGFKHEIAEELSAMSASIGSLQARHEHFLQRNLNQNACAWGLMSVTGDCQLGFWPLQIGQVAFVLVIADVPRLNRVAFRDLVWLLAQRYADTPQN